MVGRDLPHHFEAEASVVGSILIDNRVLPQVLEVVSSDDFYEIKNRKLFEVFEKLFQRSVPVDAVTVHDELQKEGIFEEIGKEYLLDLINAVPTTKNVMHYANIVKERSFLRSLIAVCDKVSEGCYACQSEIGDTCVTEIYDVMQKHKKSDVKSFKKLIYESYNEMAAMVNQNQAFTGLATGFWELDKRLSGLQNSDLILIAARPAMGKTSFALNIASNVACYQRKPVLVFSLEMSSEQLAQRIISYEAAIDSGSIRNANITEREFSRFMDSMEEIGTAPIFVDDTASLTVSGIFSRAKRMKLEHDIALVVIDYLQLMNGKKSENRQVEIAEISRSLKILAKELNIPVIAVSQLSRAPESRADARPVLSDLRESGAIEQDADVVLFLYRDEYYRNDSKDQGICEVNIAKHRAGETGSFPLGFLGRHTGFYNLDKE